jgi:hypothetical protein
MEEIATPDYVRFTLAAAPAAAAVANYCDHAEHNERVEAGWVLGAAEAFMQLALEMAAVEGVDVFVLYQARLEAIEARNVVRHDGGFNGGAAAGAASTWRELQVVQMDHDRFYHPDVVGLSRASQLRHYAFHLSKIVGALAERAAGATDRDDIIERRLPDMLLFGLKLHTVMGVTLSDDRLPGV